MEFAQLVLFIYSLATQEQIATVRLEQKFTVAQCTNNIGPAVKRVADKAPLLLGQKVRVVGECHRVKADASP